MKIYVTALVAATGLVATAAFLLTADSSVNSESAVVPATTQGMVAILDSETGALRAPTAVEAQRYVGASRASVSDAPIVRRADGSESMKLDDSYTIYSVVTRGSDGQWNRICTADHDHALDQAKTADVRGVK